MSHAAIKAALSVENSSRCTPALSDNEVDEIAVSVAKYAPAPVSPALEWPSPLRAAALHGLAGRIVNSISPYSEADPAGLLVHLLVFFGSAVGRLPHFRVASDRHALNLFAVQVGKTAKARKGVAFGHAKQLFRMAVPKWVKTCIETGLSSGEGLILAIRNRETQATHPPDRRLLVFETEFGSPLRMMIREGNTLSPVLRQAWDSTTLGVLTRRNPLKAKLGHVSLVAHITAPELKLLTRTDIFGGFANRILWTCVRRQRVRADLTGIPMEVLRPLAKELKAALSFGRKSGQLRFTRKAASIWKNAYPQLSAEYPGLVGAVVSRAEAQVVRLAGIYALMDRSRKVRSEHLRAALAVWEYCRESASIIFGKRQEHLDEQILRVLSGSQQGLTRSEISAAFHHHKDAAAISEALDRLEAEGRARWELKQTHGRPAERWFVA